MSRGPNLAEASADDENDEMEYLTAKGDSDSFTEMILRHRRINKELQADVGDNPVAVRLERKMEEPMLLQAVPEDLVYRIEDESSDMSTLEWIKKNIPARRCSQPVRTYKDQENNDVCFCFMKCADHPCYDPDNVATPLAWTKEKNTVSVPTNAFGDVCVHADDGSFEKTLKFVRLDEDISSALLQELLFAKWHLNKPHWLLTVMGEVSANSRGQKQFCTSLAKVMRQLSMKREVMLVSEGVHYGLSKLVGKSVAQCSNDCSLTPIGVIGWGCLKDADLLVSEDVRKLRHLTIPVKEKGNFMSDSIHYSLLVDNGTLHPHLCSSSYMTFTVDMIATISQHKQASSSIPCVILLYGGWSAVLDGLRRALVLEIPVIVIKMSMADEHMPLLMYRQSDVQTHSGGFADIFAAGFENCFSSNTYFNCNGSISPVVDDMLRENLRQRIQKVHGKDYKEGLHLILQCLKKPHLFTICDLKAKEDFFKVIIQALFKTKQTSELGRIFDNFFPHPISDPEFLVASGQIKRIADQTSTDATNKRSLEVILLEGILMDKAESVEFILNVGQLDLTVAFFTKETVKTIYHRTVTELPKTLSEDIQKAEVDIFEMVDSFVDLWIPNYCQLTDENKQQLSVPDKFVKYVFIWAILTNRRQIARLLWKKGKDLIVTALVANTVLRQMAETQNSVNMRNVWTAHADIFLSRAIGTLEDCFNESQDSAFDLLVQKWYNNQWNVDFINVCLLESNRKITTAKGFCHFNRAQWRGKIRFSTGVLNIVLASVVYPLICCCSIIKFRDKKKPALEQQNNKPEDNTSTSGCTRLCEFRATPIVKFIHYMICYVAFLCVYGHYLLFETTPQFSVFDGLLSVWVFSFFVEEIVQIVQFASGEHDTSCLVVCCQAVRKYWGSDWNKMDILTQTGFVIGMILHVIPGSTWYEAGRVILCVVYLFFFWRATQAFSVNKHMGPMIVMIRKMLSDLVPFLIIFFVSIASFAITQEALLYPNSVWSGDFIYTLPHKAFWQIFGEYFLDEIQGENECSNNATMIQQGTQQCPTTAGKYVTPFLLAAYILMTNVLLLNIIIAQFSFRFETIQSKADEVWMWQSCCQTLEFKKRSTFSPPLSLFCHSFRLIKTACCHICCCFHKTPYIGVNVPVVRAMMYNEPQRISPLAGAPPPTLPDSDDDNGLFSEDETDAQTTEYSKLMNLDEFEKRMGHCYLARVSGNNKN